MTPLGTLLGELPQALLVPAALAGALLGALLARYGVASLAWRLAERHRVRRASPRAAVDGLADGELVTLRGRLAVDDDGAVTLRAGATTLAVEGALVVRDRARTLPEAAARALLAKRPEALVRGVYRRRAEASGGEVYRDASARHAIVAGDGGVEVTRLGAPPPWRAAAMAALAGTVLGAMGGVVAPSVVMPRALAGTPRAPRLRVRSIAFLRVALERVPEEMDPSCRWRRLTPPRWGIARAECEPTLVLDDPQADLAAIVPGRLAAADPRATGRAIALALLQHALAAELAVRPGDAASYQTAIREHFAAGRYEDAVVLAREVPAGGLRAVAAEVVASHLFTLNLVTPRDRAVAHAAAASVSEEAAASLACVVAFAERDARPRAARLPGSVQVGSGRRDDDAYPSAAVRALAEAPGAPPACVILGATASRRGLDSLRALSALPRDSAVWRPVIDAAKNFVLLEGVASGAIRAPAPSRFEAFGDPAELRESMNPAVAHLLDATAALLEARGYARLAWQARFPAREAILRGHLLDPPPWIFVGPFLDADRAGQWVEAVALAYQSALVSFAAVRARAPRLDARALQQLRADAARFEAEAARLVAASTIRWGFQEAPSLRYPPLRAAVVSALDRARAPAPDADYSLLAPVPVARALAAVGARDERGLAEALGEPSMASLAAARIVGSFRDAADPRRCGVDSLVCAWEASLLRDPGAASRPWRVADTARILGRRAAPRAPERPFGEPPLMSGMRAARTAPARDAWGAFTSAVAEALQRSLAGAR